MRARGDRPTPVVALFHSLNGSIQGVDVGAGIKAVAGFSLVRAARLEVIVASIAIVEVHESHGVDRGREEVPGRPFAGWVNCGRGTRQEGDTVGLSSAFTSCLFYTSGHVLVFFFLFFKA